VSGDKWRELEEACLRTIPAVPDKALKELGLTTPTETTQAVGIPDVAAAGASSIPPLVPILLPEDCGAQRMAQWQKVTLPNDDLNVLALQYPRHV